MLFYNHKHEFIGIDEEGLKLLNYATLEDLLGVCSDVADLFAKEPGYIHNFKSFGWIDFLLHADSDARSAIVHGNGRTFSCTLQVSNLFLSAEPKQNGYIIDMVHIQSISGDEIKPVASKPSTSHYNVKEIPETAITISKSAPLSTDSLPDYKNIIPTPLSEPGTLDVPSYKESDFETPSEPIEDIYAKLSLPLSDTELHEETEATTPPIEARTERPMLGDVHYSKAEKEFINNLKVDKSYRFDPNVAAHELGLPVDLILEFIGDFIQQSYEFKNELFEAVLKGDSNNIKILSHKLKGVAANLRIEDAFEALSIINTSADLIEIEANLKYFYTIINKLEGKEPILGLEEAPVEVPAKTQSLSETVEIGHDSAPEDIYEFALKIDEPLAFDTDNEKNASDNTEANFLEDEKEIDLSQEEENIETILVDVPIKSLHYDKTSIASQLGIEHDFFDELIEEYKHDALKAGQEITAAIGAFDTHSWKRTASQLKGISDNLRLSEISEELAILSQTNDAQEANKASKRLNGFLEQL